MPAHYAVKPEKAYIVPVSWADQTGGELIQDTSNSMAG